MKVLKEGALDEVSHAAWTGATVKCPSCGFTAVLEGSDGDIVMVARDNTKFIVCPTKGCERKLVIPIMR